MYLRVYRDDLGDPEVETDEAHELVGWYLKFDVQTRGWCNELISITDSVERGERGPWAGTGNAFALTLSPGKVRIESAFGDPPEVCELPYDDFKQALREWLRVLDEPRG